MGILAERSAGGSWSDSQGPTPSLTVVTDVPVLHE